MAIDSDASAIAVPFKIPAGLVLARNFDSPRLFRTVTGDEIFAWLLTHEHDGTLFFGRPLQVLTFMTNSGAAQVFYKKWCGMSINEIVPLTSFDFVAAVFTPHPSAMAVYLERARQFFEEIPAEIAKQTDEPEQSAQAPQQTPDPPEPPPLTEPPDPHAAEIARLESKTDQHERIPVFAADNYRQMEKDNPSMAATVTQQFLENYTPKKTH